jgi:type IV pilus assembly protein PilN
MRITLNLATRPYADLRPALKSLRVTMGVLLVIGLGLMLGLRAFHQKAEEARATEQSVQTKIDAINRERQGYQDLMRQQANALLLAQAASLNQLFNEKTFSWTLAMEDLETVLPGSVQTTSLEPIRAKDGSITLKLRVVGPRDKAVDLVENLEHSKHFLLPRIVGESAESTGGPAERMEPISASNRVNFELLADFNPATLTDRKVERKPEAGTEKTAVESKPVQTLPVGIRPVQPTPRQAAPLPQPVRAPFPQQPANGARTGQPPFFGNGQHKPHAFQNPNQNPNQNKNPGGPQ